MSGEVREGVEEAAEIRTPLSNCARCGGEHGEVVFRRFSRPPDETLVARVGRQAHLVTHFAACPENGEPILGSFIPTEAKA